MYLLSIGLMIVTLGCGAETAAPVKETTAPPPTNTSNVTPVPAPKVLSIEDIANKNNISLGSLNSIYRLDTKYKYKSGGYMIINFQSVKHVKEIVRNQRKFNNVIMINNVLPLDQSVQIFDKAGFFTLYDENGKETGNINTYIDNGSDGTSDLFLYSDNEDLTKYKYMAFGPIDIKYANGMQLLFSIQ